jgi:hypothetical protein
MMMANATLKRYLVDLEAVLGAIPRRHLKALQAVLAELPADTPQRRRRPPSSLAAPNRHRIR